VVEVVLVNIGVDDEETETVLLVNRSLVLLDKGPGAPPPFWLLLIVAWKIFFFSPLWKSRAKRG
jgi:hypothetical protein